MENEKGDQLATSEQMLMGMDMNKRRPAPFPTAIHTRIESLGKLHKSLQRPTKAGRTVSIRRK